MDSQEQFEEKFPLCGPEIFVRQPMAFGRGIIISCVVTTFKLHICIHTYTYKHTYNACIFLDKPIKYVFFWLFQPSSVLFIFPASLFLYIVYFFSFHFNSPFFPNSPVLALISYYPHLRSSFSHIHHATGSSFFFFLSVFLFLFPNF